MRRKGLEKLRISADKPPAVTRRKLLTELDKLPHHARIKRVARLGAARAGLPDIVQLRDELSRGDAYEAGLSLILSIHMRDGAAIHTMLTHRSVRLRKVAARHVVGMVGDDVLAEAVFEAAPAIRRIIVRDIARQGSQALAERLYAEMAARLGLSEAVALLPGCGPQTVLEALPDAGPFVRGWRGLVDAHPEAVLQYLESCLREATESEYAAIWQRFDQAALRLVLTHPGRVLELVEAFLPETARRVARWRRRSLSFFIRRIGLLLRREPERTRSLLAHPAWQDVLRYQAPAGLASALPRLPWDQALATLRLFEAEPFTLVSLMEKLAPSRRAEVFHVLLEPLDKVWDDHVLHALPVAARVPVARRLLARPKVQEEPHEILRILVSDAIDTARERLEAGLQASLAEERARAWDSLITCTALSRRGLDETLQTMVRLKNEQDPVRLAAFRALEEVPVSQFATLHIELLEALTQYPLEARDTSEATRQALHRLAYRLIRHHVSTGGPLFEFAIQLLSRLAGQSGTISLPPLHDLPRGTEHAIVNSLLPYLQSAGERESWRLTVGLAVALRDRAWNVDRLQALLEPAALARHPLASSAIAAWLSNPRTRDARVERLLRHDKSAIVLSPVFNHLHRRRQDLLDPYLKGRPVKGYFATGKTVYVPPASGGFQRWLPRQQQAYVGYLNTAAGDTRRSARERVSAVQTMARLPVTSLAHISRWLQDPDVNVVEAALGALVWLDDVSDVMPRLLEHVDSDRARVAMYAIPRVASLMASSVLSRQLAELLGYPRLRVTVHKEAVRLLSAYRSADSVPTLLAEWAKPDLHRDVRIAALHAARHLLEAPEVWPLLEAAADSEERFLAQCLLDQRAMELPQAWRARYADLVLRVCDHADVLARRAAWRVLPDWSRGKEGRFMARASRTVTALENTPDWRDALSALVSMARSGAGDSIVVSAAATLATAPVGPQSKERDLPERQRLLSLLAHLKEWSGSVRLRRQSLFQATALALAAWPRESASLRLNCLDFNAPEAADAVSTATVPLRDRPDAARNLVERVLAKAPRPWTPATLRPVADRLSLDETAGVRLLALPFVAALGQRTDWVEEDATRLRSLRNDPDATVRDAAMRCFMAAE